MSLDLGRGTIGARSSVLITWFSDVFVGCGDWCCGEAGGRSEMSRRRGFMLEMSFANDRGTGDIVRLEMIDAIDADTTGLQCLHSMIGS